MRCEQIIHHPRPTLCLAIYYVVHKPDLDVVRAHITLHPCKSDKGVSALLISMMIPRRWRIEHDSLNFYLLLLEKEGSATTIDAIEHENVVGRLSLSADSFDDLIADDPTEDSANGRHFRPSKGSHVLELVVITKIILANSLALGQPRLGLVGVIRCVILSRPLPSLSSIIQI